MFISKAELEEIRATMKAQAKQIKSLRQAIEAQKKTNKLQAEKNKKYDEQLGKRYLSDTFAGKSEEEARSIMDEWLNGEEGKK